jgi:8-oxo-dGTP pyrophosphatase MutT (NUDIX family)
MRRAFSVAVYPRHQGRVLLIRHRRLDLWLPPGGECEPGETPLEAAARELREETGLVGRFPALSDIDGTPAGLIGYEEHVAGSKGVHMNFVFVADVDTDEVVPNAEFTDWKWVDTADGIGGPPNVAQLARVALAAGSRCPACTRPLVPSAAPRDDVKGGPA